MKFLIMGAAGMAGHTIALYLHERGHNVLGFARRAVSFFPCIVGDAINLDIVEELICNGNFDAVINCIGILNQFAEQDKSRAVFLNSYFPHFLARITDKAKTQIIHLSTDCVFSGKSGNYTEDSLRDGETFYDRSKALGELEDNKNITLRNSIIGPDINSGGIGLLNWFMKQSGEINGYAEAMWTGMTTLQLAKMIELAAMQRVCGLYHMVPDHNISKYKLLELFNHFFKHDSLRILPCTAVTVDKTLIRTHFAFQETVPDYATMVSELAEWMKDHATLYPHYLI